VAKGARGPSIRDVARRAGVSPQTVSRVLNDFAGIRVSTRERVLEAMVELNYRTNLAARTLVTGRSNTIGMIGPDIPEIGPLSSLHAVERAAREAGFHTLLTSTSPAPDDVAGALEFLLGRGIDALVLVAEHRSVQKAVDAAIGDLPVVHLLTGGFPPRTSISIDQASGVRAAMEHLFALGHRRIQHISGPLAYSEAQLRRDAFRDMIFSAGLEEFPIIEGDWTPDSGYAAGLRLDPRATAVFSANDQMSFGLIHALADQGKSVPGHVSVVSFDDTLESRHSLPPLTTVHQDFEAVGKLAVKVLVARIAGEQAPPNDLVVPWLVERSSTAGPRAAA
jgi:DNA-binding LacI/PurR family transcriptional regulator